MSHNTSFINNLDLFLQDFRADDCPPPLELVQSSLRWHLAETNVFPPYWVCATEAWLLSRLGENNDLSDTALNVVADWYGRYGHDYPLEDGKPVSWIAQTATRAALRVY